MSFAVAHRILRSEVLPALEALVGAESAARFIASEPAPRRKRAGKFAYFSRCVCCNAPHSGRKSPSPECGKCAARRGGIKGMQRRWHPGAETAEARFKTRFLADAQFRRVEGAAMAMRMIQIGMHPPLRMLEELEQRAGSPGEAA